MKYGEGAAQSTTQRFAKKSQADSGSVTDFRARVRIFYRLAKPGIIYGNLLPVIAGFFLASRGNINLALFIETALGISLVMGSACVFNNFIDRDIDKRMDRTKGRALASGKISARAALLYASMLGVLGFGTLLLFTNVLTTVIAGIGFVFYVILYGWAKRRSVHGTLVGSISGAVPPAVGYCAVSNHFGQGALLIFLALVFWQMPHFYAIATYRAKDYARAGLPVLPVKKSIQNTKWQILLYTVAFVITTIAFWVEGYTGYTYLLIMLGVGAWWLRRALAGFTASDDAAWARKMFFNSLIVLVIFTFALSVDWWLP